MAAPAITAQAVRTAIDKATGLAVTDRYADEVAGRLAEQVAAANAIEGPPAIPASPDDHRRAFIKLLARLAAPDADHG